MIGIKRLVCPHNRHQILRVAQVDDVMGVSGQHVDGLDLLAGHLKLDHLIRANPTLLDKAMAGHHDKELPLGIVPVLALGDAGLGNVHGELTAGCRPQELGKAAAIVYVHL